MSNYKLEWQDRALCALRRLPVDWFFPPVGQRPHPEAIAACDECEVRKECRDHARTYGITAGMWGGRTQHQRKNRRDRGDAA